MTIGAINNEIIQASGSAEPATLGEIPTYCRAWFQHNRSNKTIPIDIINDNWALYVHFLMKLSQNNQEDFAVPPADPTTHNSKKYQLQLVNLHDYA